MAIIRTSEMREMSERDLAKRLEELKLELSKARAQISVGGVQENRGRVKEIRRTIARALTLKREAKSKSSKAPAKQAAPRGGKK